jgi:hypothetical protein
MSSTRLTGGGGDGETNLLKNLLTSVLGPTVEELSTNKTIPVFTKLMNNVEQAGLVDKLGTSIPKVTLFFDKLETEEIVKKIGVSIPAVTTLITTINDTQLVTTFLTTLHLIKPYLNLFGGGLCFLIMAVLLGLTITTATKAIAAGQQQKAATATVTTTKVPKVTQGTAPEDATEPATGTVVVSAGHSGAAFKTLEVGYAVTSGVYLIAVLMFIFLGVKLVGKYRSSYPSKKSTSATKA